MLKIKRILIDAIVGALVAVSLVLTFVPPKALSQAPILQQIAFAIWKPASNSFESLSVCDKTIGFTITTGSVIIQQGATAQTKVYICEFDITNAGVASTFNLFEGMAGILTPTVANCVLTPTSLLGGHSVGNVSPTEVGNSYATGTISLTSATYSKAAPFPFMSTQNAGDSVCVGVSGAGPFSGSVSYNIH